MVTVQDPANVLFGATRRRLLAWLYGHPDESFYLRELLRQTGAPEGAAQRELAALTAAGLLTRSHRGNQVFFQANTSSPIFHELLSIITKTTGIADVLRSALNPLASRIQAAFVYGSAARGELKQGSDIDLLVVGHVSFGELVERLSGAQQTLGRDVNPSVYSPDEFRTKLAAGHHFLSSVLGTPLLFLIGGRDDVERLGAGQQMVGGASNLEAGNRQSSGRGRPKPERRRHRRTHR